MNICPVFFPVLQQERAVRVPDHGARDGALGGHQGVARAAHHQVSLFGIKKFEILSFFSIWCSSRNMKSMYEESDWGWNEKHKKDEMLEESAW